MGDITDVIAETASDGGTPLELLWPVAYAELKQLARSRLQRSAGLTLLDSTALVNESYLKLIAAGQTSLQVVSRKHFFAYASRVMRSVVVDLARERASLQRGGGADKLTLQTALLDTGREDDPGAVHEALQSLEQVEPRLALIVQMRYFGGLTEIEIAEALDLGERTVRRDWEKARALLRAMLED